MYFTSVWDVITTVLIYLRAATSKYMYITSCACTVAAAIDVRQDNFSAEAVIRYGLEIHIKMKCWPHIDVRVIPAPIAVR